jgi:hypothetical protein
MFFFGKIVITSSFVVNNGLKSHRPPTVLGLVLRENCGLDEEANWRIPFQLSAKRTSESPRINGVFSPMNQETNLKCDSLPSLPLSITIAHCERLQGPHGKE